MIISLSLMVTIMSKYIAHLKYILRLSFVISQANFKTAYARSWLGYLWYILNPILLFSVLILLKQKGGVFSSDIPQYPLYLLIGIVLFQYFIKTTTAGLSAFQKNRNLIKNMKLPLEIFVISYCLTFIYTHFFDFLLICIGVIVLGVNISGLFIYPFIFLMFSMFTFGVTILLAPLAIFILDINNIWQFAGTFLFLSTPIFYVLPETNILYIFSMANPLFIYIELSREIFLFNKINSVLLLSAISFSICIPILGILFFRIQEKRIAEYL